MVKLWGHTDSRWTQLHSAGLLKCFKLCICMTFPESMLLPFLAHVIKWNIVQLEKRLFNAIVGCTIINLAFPKKVLDKTAVSRAVSSSHFPFTSTQFNQNYFLKKCHGAKLRERIHVSVGMQTQFYNCVQKSSGIH